MELTTQTQETIEHIIVPKIKTATTTKDLSIIIAMLTALEQS